MNAKSFASNLMFIASAALAFAACSEELPTSAQDSAAMQSQANAETNQPSLNRMGPRMYRPVDEFVRAQGAARASDIFNQIGLIGGTITWQNPESNTSAVIDYAGALFRAQIRDFPLAVDSPEDIEEPIYTGRIMEQIMGDGTVRVQVELLTRRALAYAVRGMDPVNDEVVVGGRHYKDERTSRANSRMLLVFRTATPGAPMPDLTKLLFLKNDYQRLEWLQFTAVTDREIERPLALQPMMEVAQPGLVDGSYVAGPVGALPASIVTEHRPAVIIAPR